MAFIAGAFLAFMAFMASIAGAGDVAMSFIAGEGAAARALAFMAFMAGMMKIERLACEALGCVQVCVRL